MMKLNNRQKDVLKYAAIGCTNPEIAKILQISTPYVQNILQGLYQITETKNKHHLVAWAYRNGVLC